MRGFCARSASATSLQIVLRAFPKRRFRAKLVQILNFLAPELVVLSTSGWRDMEDPMSTQGDYSQFCPVAMTAEVFCQKWTALVLREMLCGSTRFNDLRRGVPKMSPSLLSKRLKELMKAGVIEEANAEYRLTKAGEELRPIIMAMGFWGQRWVESHLSLKNLDASLLMWDMRRFLDPKPLPKRRCVISYHFPEAKKGSQLFWLVVETNGKIDLCSEDPGFDVDLYVTVDLRAMTAIWMGLSTVKEETENGTLSMDGSPSIASAMQHWLGLSPFAKEKNQLAA
jgi:DNA-binding HxlR family transcriptional regulator